MKPSHGFASGCLSRNRTVTGNPSPGQLPVIRLACKRQGEGRPEMFEKLTVEEAAELMRKLTSGYDSSRELQRDLRAWARATSDNGLWVSYHQSIVHQAAMRAENTSLRWQLKREALS